MLSSARESHFGRMLADTKTFGSGDEDKCDKYLKKEDVETCNSDPALGPVTECSEYPWYTCGAECPGICSHKTVFPMLGLEYGGLAVFGLIMALSNVAGIGGGGVAIPLVMAFFTFTTKPAIAISSFSIFVCTIARWLFNFNERHPEKKDCIVIDYGLTTIMMPTTLAGS